MNRKLTLGAILALAAAPAVFAPRLLPAANAQPANMGDVPANAQTAEYPDVPRNHWAYDALNQLSRVGVIEGRPGGTYNGNEPMTRYEFAVAIARLLRRIPGQVTLPPPTPPYDDTGLRNRITTLEGRPVPDIFRNDVVALIDALRTEFRDELNRLGVRVTEVENRVTALENRVPAPPRQTLTLAALHRLGYANYINAGSTGRSIVNGNNDSGAFSGGANGSLTPRADGSTDDKRFSYTDLELRLTDRVTDRLSATAALRSLGSTQEDPWTGDTGGGVYVRELYAVADLSDRRFPLIRGLSAVLGRQRTRLASGLLYDNQLSPTDQVHGMFTVGPFAINAFTGSVNNQTVSGNGVLGSGAGNPYLTSGAAAGLSGSGLPSNVVGFPGTDLSDNFTEDNETAIHAGANLFRIGGQPVQIGATALRDGVAQQKGYSFDLTLPLFNRVVGFEYARQTQYANGTDPSGSSNPGAYIVTLPALRTRILDLDLAYGRANDRFEYFLSSTANPYARSYGEAIFDRSMFLGAPLINGSNAGGANFMAAKRGYDVSGTARIPLPLIRRVPLDFRFYRARGTDDADLGKVYTVGTQFNLTPGLDIEVKYGRYNPDGAADSINYYRIGASLGF
jgi:hypothetical protein